MDTAELVCLVLILIVLVVAVVFSCTRCWGSVATIAGESDAKPTSGFPRDVGNRLRRSFRKATSFWGARAETFTSSPTQISSVSADVIHGSDLHPVYFRPRQTTDSPPRDDEVVTKPGSTQPGGVGAPTGERERVYGFTNPAYAVDSVESGDVDTFNRTYIQLTNSGIVFPDDERQCFQSETYI